MSRDCRISDRAMLRVKKNKLLQSFLSIREAEAEGSWDPDYLEQHCETLCGKQSKKSGADNQSLCDGGLSG